MIYSLCVHYTGISRFGPFTIHLLRALPTLTTPCELTALTMLTTLPILRMLLIRAVLTLLRLLGQWRAFLQGERPLPPPARLPPARDRRWGGHTGCGQFAGATLRRAVGGKQL